MAGRYNQNLKFPKVKLTVRSNFVVKYVTHISQSRPKKMRKNGIQRMQTKWKLCKQNSHELQLSVRNVKNIFFHKILPKA